VLITRGRHKGTVVYYDDDEAGVAIVYLGAPFVAPAVRLRRYSLTKITAKSAAVEKWKRQHPWLARQLGVR
jgi:hypothetical protein